MAIGWDFSLCFFSCNSADTDYKGTTQKSVQYFPVWVTFLDYPTSFVFCFE